MIIKQKRIRSIRRHLPGVKDGDTVVLGVPFAEHIDPSLPAVGFSGTLELGERVLPPPDFGPATRFNANGGVEVHRDQPMETAYRLIEWHWSEYHGRERVERSDFRDCPYQRYPRTAIPAPSVELYIGRLTGGEPAVLADPMVMNSGNENAIRHTVNVLLEIFGECHVFTATNAPIAHVPGRRVNWEVLPPGRWPWDRLRPLVQPVLQKAKEGNRPVIEDRLQTIASYEPSFVAVGRAGFTGYLIHGFPELGLHLLESAYYGNATYVLGDDWEQLSQLTKAELIADGLHHDRIVHRKGWHDRVRQLLAAQEGVA